MHSIICHWQLQPILCVMLCQGWKKQAADDRMVQLNTRNKTFNHLQSHSCQHAAAALIRLSQSWRVRRQDMNCFFASSSTHNSSTFYFLRFRLKSLTKGHRRHQLLLTSRSSDTCPRVLVSVNTCDQFLSEDEDENDGSAFFHGMDG